MAVPTGVERAVLSVDSSIESDDTHTPTVSAGPVWVQPYHIQRRAALGKYHGVRARYNGLIEIVAHQRRN